MIITHKLEMDMTRKETVPQISVVQGDSNTRVLEVALLSGGEIWTVPEPVSISLRYCKSDGTRGLYNTLPDGSRAWSVSGNRITMVLAPQMLTVEGLALAQLELSRGESVLATFMIHVNVERNPAAGVLQSEDYVSMLQWATAELDRCLAEAKESGLFDGPQGTQGPQGEKGEPGLDPYAYALAAGYAGSEAAFQQQYITPSLPLSGGTMAGDIAMGGRRISGLSAPVQDGDAASKSYVEGNFIRVVKLWENASPTSEFTAQTISLDLSNCQWIAICQKLSTTASGTRIQFGEVGRTMTMDVLLGASGNVGSRSCTVGTTSVRFLDGNYNAAQNDAYVIPYVIYGIQGVNME